MKAPAIGYAAAFVAGILATLLWQWFSRGFARIYPVQFLSSPDRAHQAVLERTEFMDLNFEVKLDGRVIYRSPDFAPDPTLAHRETLLWDDSGNILILEIAGQRLFGYDVTRGKALSSAALPRVKVRPTPLPAYGFEGQWPSSSTKRSP